MSSASSPLHDISDTALVTALARAQESERADALFHDPYARLLAGDRAEQIVRKLHGGKTTSWPIVVRTCIIDEFVSHLIEHEQVDVVLNLAAGLDARPYRLSLSPSLNWIEVDLPELLSYKEQKLAQRVPKCILERIPADLSNAQVWQELIERVGQEGRAILVLTEGLLVYLPTEQVKILATDLHRYENIKWWVTDLTSPLALKMIQGIWGKHLQAARAVLKFAPREGGCFFQPYGWDVVESRSGLGEAHRLKREMFVQRVMRWVARIPLKGLREQVSFGECVL